jgi:pimeloyl-ACP methyl ester carboxylesterase
MTQLLDGSLTQGASLPLLLKKVDKPSERNRPQLPVPPFPYDSYDVEYDNADKTVHFGATLTVPKPDPNIRYIKAPEYPVIILITGSGQQDRDESLMGHKPFAVIADHLTRNGFAVLRVDDRGMGKTKGDLSKATSADYAKDVEQFELPANKNRN